MAKKQVPQVAWVQPMTDIGKDVFYATQPRVCPTVVMRTLQNQDEHSGSILPPGTLRWMSISKSELILNCRSSQGP